MTSLKDVFLHQSKLFMIKGDCGVGKTYLIEKSLLESSKKIQLITYDAVDFKIDSFQANLYSKKLDQSKVVIVLSHLESFPKDKIEYIVSWAQKRTNFKRSVDFKFKNHASVIMECDIVYNSYINQLTIEKNDIIVVLQPSLTQKLKLVHDFFPACNELVVADCVNYNDVLIRINELQHDANLIDVIIKPIQNQIPKVVKNPALQLYYQQQALKTIKTLPSPKKTIKYKPNPKDLNLCKDSIFMALDCIRTQSQTARGLIDCSFNKCLTHDIDEMADKYHALLPVFYGFEPIDILNNISKSSDTFCDVDLHMFPREIKDSFYQIAIVQSPTYILRPEYHRSASTGHLDLKAHSWGRKDKERIDVLSNIQFAINCVGVNRLGFLETLWMMNDCNNLLEWEIFPVDFLEWNDDHRKAHNKNAIQFTRFTGIMEQKSQIKTQIQDKTQDKIQDKTQDKIQDKTQDKIQDKFQDKFSQDKFRIQKRKYNREEAATKRRLLDDSK